MRTYQTLVIGAGCWGAGLALSGRRDLLIVDRGAVVGAEYFDTYAAPAGWHGALHTAEARELYRAMTERNALGGGAPDTLVLAPFLYRKLIPFHGALRLWTEVIGVEAQGDGYTVTLFDADGQSRIKCDELIDMSATCLSNPEFGRRNLAARYLNAVAVAPDAAALLANWQPAEGEGDMRSGRTPDELYFRIRLEPAYTWATAREKLLRAWNARRELYYRHNKLAFIAKRFEYVYHRDGEALGPNHIWLNPAACPNPLQALDAGLLAARATVNLKMSETVLPGGVPCV